jgi:hypothetical protein
MLFVNSNKTVHRGIKDIAVELMELAAIALDQKHHNEKLHTDYQEDFNNQIKYRDEMIKSLEYEINGLRNDLKNAKDECCSKCKANKYDLQIEEIKSLDGLINSVEKEWTEESYKQIKMESIDPLKIDAEDIFYVSIVENESQRQLVYRAMKRYPELSEGEKIPCGKGSRTTMEMTMKLGSLTKKRNISIINNIATEEMIIENTFEVLNDIKELLQKRELKKIAVILYGLNPDVARKTAAFVFRDSNIENIRLICSDKLGGTKTIRQGEAIIIEGNEESYADIL